MRFRCAYCRKVGDKPANEFNRARRSGLNLYCNRRCSGLGRRMGKTKAQRVAEKAAYDAAYRASNAATLKAKKREYHKRTYDPAAAAVVRKANMPRHVEYCRQPEYRRKKKAYDRKHRATKLFGPFAEAAMLVNDLNIEIRARSNRHEIKYQDGCTNKSQRREREAGQGPSRNRHSTANR